MAGSLNKVLLIGRLGADPEIKQMVNGKNVARLSLATSQSWKDKSTGEKKEKTEWHRIVVFNEGLVNVVQQYLKKGAQIYIEGQLSTRKWKDEQSGQDQQHLQLRDQRRQRLQSQPWPNHGMRRPASHQRRPDCAQPQNTALLRRVGSRSECQGVRGQLLLARTPSRGIFLPYDGWERRYD